MKKTISLILACVVFLTACSSQVDTSEEDNGKEVVSTENAENTNNTSTKEETESEGEKEHTSIETDKNLLNVEITLPASMFEGQDLSSFDEEEYAKEQNFKSAKVNDDGSITVQMSKNRHNELMEEMRVGIQESFDDIIESEETPYVLNIDYKKDYSVINVYVDREGYENGGIMAAFIPLSVYVCTSMYHAFNASDPTSEINILDAETEDLIESVTYPDALKS